MQIKVLIKNFPIILKSQMLTGVEGFFDQCRKGLRQTKSYQSRVTAKLKCSRGGDFSEAKVHSLSQQ